VHYFKNSLKVGQAGEEMLLKLWPDLQRLDGRKHDFIVKSTGQTLELKTDTYSMAQTPNFFIELWSNLDKGKKGGPWQALANGTDLWCYMFAKDKTAFLFNTAELVAALDVLIEKYPGVSIPNQSWTTVGCKVPRSVLESYYRILLFDGSSNE
jgi:hypothetical protein